jgi:hypothetical protein
MSYSIEANICMRSSSLKHKETQVSKSPADQKTASVASTFFSKTSQFFRTLAGVPLAITFSAIAIPTTALMLIPQLLFKKVNPSRATFFAFNILAIPLQIILGLNRNVCDTILEKNEQKGNLILGMIPTNLNKDAFKEKARFEQPKSITDLNRSSTTVIDLTKKDERVTSIMGTPLKEDDWGSSIDYINLESPDGLPVSFDLLVDGADHVNQKLIGGDVIVHCKSGVGRSASIIIAYLIKHEGMSFDEAFNLVKSKRKINLSKDQKESLKDFEIKLKSKQTLDDLGSKLGKLEIKTLQKLQLKLSGLNDREISKYFDTKGLKNNLTEDQKTLANKANNRTQPISQMELGTLAQEKEFSSVGLSSMMKRYELYNLITSVLSKKYEAQNL